MNSSMKKSMTRSMVIAIGGMILVLIGGVTVVALSGYGIKFSQLIPTVVLCVALFLVSLFSLINVSRTAKYLTKFAKDGYTKETIAMYAKLYGKKNESNKTLIGNMYMTIYDYVDAEKWFSSVNISKLPPSSRAYFHIKRMNLYSMTDRCSLAEEEYSANKLLIEDAKTNGTLISEMYYEAMSNLYAKSGDYERALDFMKTAEDDMNSENAVYGTYGFFVKKNLVRIYYHLGDDILMSEKKREALEALEKVKEFPYEWSKQILLDGLEKAEKGLF